MTLKKMCRFGTEKESIEWGSPLDAKIAESVSRASGVRESLRIVGDAKTNVEISLEHQSDRPGDKTRRKN